MFPPIIVIISAVTFTWQTYPIENEASSLTTNEGWRLSSHRLIIRAVKITNTWNQGTQLTPIISQLRYNEETNVSIDNTYFYDCGKTSIHTWGFMSLIQSVFVSWQPSISLLRNADWPCAVWWTPCTLLNKIYPKYLKLEVYIMEQIYQAMFPLTYFQVPLQLSDSTWYHSS